MIGPTQPPSSAGGPALARRALLGGFALGALTCAARAAAQTADSLAFGPISASGPMSDTATVPASVVTTTETQRRVLAAAVAQRDRVTNLLWHNDLIAIADFAPPSGQPRFHFADLVGGTVRSFLVAHGRGSDPEHDGFLKSFSNAMGSLATSRGAFLSTGWYHGKYGTSIRLDGIDPDNSNAFDRALVVHPAWYANPDMVGKYGKLGRSEGCFAMSEADFAEVLTRLGAGRLLFADRLALS